MFDGTAAGMDGDADGAADATASPEPADNASPTIETTHPGDPNMRVESPSRSDIKSDTRHSLTRPFQHMSS